MFSKKFLTILILISIVLLACANQVEFNIADQREELGDVFVESTGNVDNSNGNDTLVQDITARREFRHSINLSNLDSRLDRRDVEERILETYELPGAVGEKLCSFPADVPAGAIYAYDIEWTQVLREGNIVEGSDPNGRILGTYSIVVDLQCQTVGVDVIRAGN